MKYPSISERIKHISQVLLQRPDLSEQLILKREILRVQTEVEIVTNKEAANEWINKLALPSLEKRGLQQKKPILNFLDTTMFDVESLLPVFRKVISVISRIHPECESLIEHIATEDLENLLEAILKEETKTILHYATKGKIEPTLLFFMINALIQPHIEEIAQRASSSFYTKWWRANCPICGRRPHTARIRERRRYLLCAFCGASYPSDYFLCTHCGNKDPYTLKYLQITAEPAYQIDFCTRCKHYIKSINEDKLTESIPRLMEDILTLDLDIEAKNAGLIRP